MTYKITRINIDTDERKYYGSGYSESYMKQIVRGYSFNGDYYERSSSHFIFIVENTEDIKYAGTCCLDKK